MLLGGTGPITVAFAVTPSDTAELPEVARALCIRTTGAVHRGRADTMIRRALAGSIESHQTIGGNV